MSIQMSAVIKAVVQGGDASAGFISISVPGLRAGDVLLINPSSSFEPVISVDDHIVQYGGNYTSYDPYIMVLARFGS